MHYKVNDYPGMFIHMSLPCLLEDDQYPGGDFSGAVY